MSRVCTPDQRNRGEKYANDHGGRPNVTTVVATTALILAVRRTMEHSDEERATQKTGWRMDVAMDRDPWIKTRRPGATRLRGGRVGAQAERTTQGRKAGLDQ